MTASMQSPSSLASAATAAAPRRQPALQVGSICAGYGGMTVLRHLSLHVDAGEIVGVLGANGMGKSTLMKALAGLLPTSAGRIEALGRDLTPAGAHVRARLGVSYVPQGRGILPTLSVQENLAIAWLGGEESEADARARVLALFPRLARLLERAGGALSGGEQQLLALARAMMPRPQLLLLDEPTEGIQPSIIEEIAQTLLALRSSTQLSILVVEQNLDFILDCADRVLTLEKGAITADLPASALADPQLLAQHSGFGTARSTRGPSPTATAAPRSSASPSPGSRSMTLRRPTPAQVRTLAAGLHMALSDAEAAEYTALMEGSFLAYDRVDALPDFVPEVRWPRTPGTRPSAAENLLNAWYVKTDVRGAARGPLAGRRVVLKDNIALAGVPMMNGASTLEGYVPEFDATVATRILDAGGTIVGKAHCEYFCLSGGSHTNATGPVHNPWRMGYIAGGSSSGCGALVGAGEVEMAIGGDQGGSIRIPAAFSGCYGMKPTHGLVPYTGAMPIEATIDHLGPLTCTVADNALLLEVIAGPDGLDARQTQPRVTAYASGLGSGVGGLTIGVVRQGFGHANSEAQLDAKVRAAAARFERLGAAVVDIDLPEHLDGAAIWTAITLEGMQAQMMHGNGTGFNYRGLYSTSLLDRHAAWRERADELSPSLKVSMFVGEWFLQHHRGRFYAKAQNQSRRLALAYDRALTQCDLLVMPTLPITAQPIPAPGAPISEVVQRAFEMVTNTAPFNATGHPAMSVPCGLVSGLPVGMMLVGKHWDEATIYRAAAAFEALGDWRTF
jgi:amidase